MTKQECQRPNRDARDQKGVCATKLGCAGQPGMRPGMTANMRAPLVMVIWTTSVCLRLGHGQNTDRLRTNMCLYRGYYALERELAVCVQYICVRAVHL